MVTKGVTVDLEELRVQLREAKEKERPNRIPSLREAVEVLLHEIDGLRRARWSDAQIAEWLGKRGVNISAGTLAQYVREARKTSAAMSSDMKSETRPKRAPKDTAGVTPKAPANDGDVKSTTTTEPSANRPKASDVTVVETKPERKPEPATVSPAVSSRVRAPNPEGAIPTRRKLNDDA